MTQPSNRHERRRAGRIGTAAPLPLLAPARPGGQLRALLDNAARLRDRGDHRGALQLCNQAVAFDPGNPEIHFTAATVLEAARDLPRAIDAYRQVLRLRPGFLPAMVNCAACLADRGELPESLDLYEKALRVDPKSLPVRQNLAQVLMRMQRAGEAAVHFSAIAAAKPGPVELTDLADALDQAGEREQALAAYRRALERGAPAAAVHVLMARVELVRGHLDEARKHLEEALAADPLDGYAHHTLASNFAEPDALPERIAAAEKALAAAQGKPVEIAAAPLNFALGSLNDRAGNYDEAFRYFEAGNALFAARQVQEDDRIERRARRVTQEFTPEFIAARQDWGLASEQPVFVFGLPRSGSTLIEQILSSHGEVAGLGERDMTAWIAAYLQTLTRERVRRAAEACLASYPAPARGKRRVIDKSLGSYLELPLLLLMFPNATFINALRHPLDAGFSAWSHYFADNAVVFTYSFDRLARYMRLYAEVLRHWHRAFPGRILDVRYEDLVHAPEEMARRAVAHLGLEWDPRCLEFHRTRREVRTASITQVRQSIYTGSLGRWRNYERHLEPLRARLQDIVDAYEAGHGYGWETGRG